jgi:hypothetical protein
MDHMGQEAKAWLISACVCVAGWGGVEMWAKLKNVDLCP